MTAERSTGYFEDARKVVAPDARFWRHAVSPMHIGACAHASASVTGTGSCGDKMHIDLRIEDQVIAEIKCIPQGCIYTLVCASALAVLAEGRSMEEALGIEPEDVARELDGLPDDHMHCARLAVNTLGDAIAEYYGHMQEAK